MRSLTRQNGLTIVELMIAVLLGVALLLGILQVFDANKQSSRLQTAFARVQESGRIAVDLLARDIRNADHWGCSKISTNFANNLNSGGAAHLDRLLNGGVDGENDVAVDTQIGSLDVTPDTDVLVLRGGYTPDDVGLDNKQPHGTSIHLRDGSGSFVEMCGVYILTDCQGHGDIFQNTGSNSPANSDNMGHNSGGSCSPGNQNLGPAGTWASGKDIYRGDTSLLIPYEITYFLSEGVNGQSALFKRVDSDAAEEIVPNVVDMQVLYGDGGGQFADASAVAAMQNVVAVRIELTVQSEQAVSNGNPLRRTYTATSNIRNRSL